MRWVVKTSIDGIFIDDVFCVGEPLVPGKGSMVLIAVEGRYDPGVVIEVQIDKTQHPAVMQVICLSPEAYSKG